MTEVADLVVVDASVAVKWLIGGEINSDRALLLLDRFRNGRIGIAAPYHLRYEVISAVTTASRGDKPRITIAESRELIKTFLAMEIETVIGDDLLVLAFVLAHQYGCALYDALYLALAEFRGIPLITADRKFYRQVRDLSSVLWLSNYSPPS